MSLLLLFLVIPRTPRSTLFPYTTLFRSDQAGRVVTGPDLTIPGHPKVFVLGDMSNRVGPNKRPLPGVALVAMQEAVYRSEEHTSELQSQSNLVCRLLLEKKKEIVSS